MKILYLSILLIFLFPNFKTQAQGCVAIRGFSTCGGNVGEGLILGKGEWSIGTGFRYFQSFRHFRGSEQETHRIAEGTQVINDSWFMDFSATYAFTNRFYATLIIPTVYHERSSMYEHGGNPPNGLGERHKTYSKGLADVRLSSGYWIFDPQTAQQGNMALALGVKLPTGDFEATGTFYNQGPERNETRTSVVDQSIQPGDGGLGVTVELQGFRMISERFMLSGNFYYLVNPQATNGVLTRNGNSEFSVPDQYALRIGGNFLLPKKGLNLYLGPRMEAVPSTDLIGSSEGYRRPGYAISIEPGMGYNAGRTSVNLSIPVAIIRNRTKSYADKLSGGHGDAAFADYLINISLNYRISKKMAGIHKIETID